MSQPTTPRIGHCRTSVFTLPQKQKQQPSQSQSWQKQKQKQKHLSNEKQHKATPKNTTTTTTTTTKKRVNSPIQANYKCNNHNNNNNNNDHDHQDDVYETFSPEPRSPHSSPSISWLADYLSASLFGGSLDTLCVGGAADAVVNSPCGMSPIHQHQDQHHQHQQHQHRSSLPVSEEDAYWEQHYTHEYTHTFTPLPSTESSSSLFSRSLPRSQPVVTKSPTRMSSSRWNALRSVVASRDEYLLDPEYEKHIADFDVCRNRSKSRMQRQSNDKDNENHNQNENHNHESSSSSALYNPTKSTNPLQQQQQPQPEENHNHESSSSSALYNPTKSTNPLQQQQQQQQQQQRRRKSSIVDEDYDLLHSKQQESSHQEPARGFGSASSCSVLDPYLDTTRYWCASAAVETSNANNTTGPSNRRRMRLASAAASATRGRSLSQSQSQAQDQTEAQTETQTPPSPSPSAADTYTTAIAIKAQDQTEAQTETQTPPSPSPSAADTYTTISLSQSFAQEFEDSDDEEEDYKERSPLRPRTKSSIFPKSVGEFKEEELEDHLTNNNSNSNNNNGRGAADHSAYRCLVRMGPSHYKHHGESMSFSHGEDRDEIVSNASSSVLLPLHPHQRVLSHDDDGNHDPGFRLELREALRMPEF
eukprot:CAMPEP_0172411052 /NCGR_PEP_ID=MMETSP1061-20121228/77191_1 /TAXON_ID=37318 /ORGANISM="Pseudo-nitzschia pungens, Strain cf. pungens" /LENGTH=644 /DNA_ID=CAMNT_0013147257 /DNA_START=609 /DNA_END=2545 /DNA_ORIENTATION=-